VAPYQIMQQKVTALELALVAKEEEQRKLREAIKAKNFELKSKKQ